MSAQSHEFKAAFKLKNSGKHELLYCASEKKFYAIDVEEQQEPICPECGEYGTWFDGSDDIEEDPEDQQQLRWCTRKSCSRYHEPVTERVCHGDYTGGGKGGKKECEQNTELMQGTDAWGVAQVSVAVETVPKLRSLEAAIRDADDWKGTAHHKDKRGSHTASETNTHQRGQRETSQHKQAYIERINDLLDEIGRDVVPPGVLQEAERVIRKLDQIK